MTTRRLEGWLFDVDEFGPEVVLWVYDNDRRLHKLRQSFHPSVYIGGDREMLTAFGKELERRGLVRKPEWVIKTEFWSGAAKDVLELKVLDSSLLSRLRALAAAREKEFTIYNIDINTLQYYLYVNQLFPLCRLEAVVDEGSRVLEIGATDDPHEIKTQLPSLREMRMWGEMTLPLGANSRVILEYRDESIRINLNSPAEAIRDFNFFVARHDPDVILSKRGDSLLFPVLFKFANQKRHKLCADRDDIVTRRTIITEGRTFHSYGQVIYKGPAYPLRGRWHIDVRNSFFHKETGLDGIIEMARLAKIPVQRMARQSMGTAMTSIQLDLAVKEDILIPWHKTEPERYKTALELLTIDKGGLTFQPKLGAYEDVAEIDFASMYPTIMARHNVSPETVLCSCCDNRDVPEAGYNVCKKRRGLIARALEPFVERRQRYKQMMKECTDETLRVTYDNRRASIKWMLVSCFGYLGYKNSRFGRIEAHEAVTAYGREKLLKAKELAESRGFRLLHALTDSLWIKKPGMTRTELSALCDEITDETGVEMSVEGVYRWIIFLPSKQKDSRPVATRYYGLFDDGTMKYRGLACRRRDTPPYIKETQFEILRILTKAKNLKERENLRGEIEGVVRRRIEELESGKVELSRLALKRTVTKNVHQYQAETRTSQAAQQLEDVGAPIKPGESVKYIITDARSKKKPPQVKAYPLHLNTSYDAPTYVEMLLAAVDEIYGLS
jgi:DNA polymerase II